MQLAEALAGRPCEKLVSETGADVIVAEIKRETERASGLSGEALLLFRGHRGPSSGSPTTSAPFI